MGTILEPPGEKKEDSSLKSKKLSYKKSRRKYSENITIGDQGLSSNQRYKTKIISDDSLLDPISETNKLEGSIFTGKTRPRESNIEEEDEGSDSSNDAIKFLKAAQANAQARLSEK